MRAWTDVGACLGLCLSYRHYRFNREFRSGLRIKRCKIRGLHECESAREHHEVREC